MFIESFNFKLLTAWQDAPCVFEKTNSKRIKSTLGFHGHYWVCLELFIAWKVNFQWSHCKHTEILSRVFVWTLNSINRIFFTQKYRSPIPSTGCMGTNYWNMIKFLLNEKRNMVEKMECLTLAKAMKSLL